jgi:hypothetical protein
LCALDEGRLKRIVLKKVKSDIEDEKFESCRLKKIKDKYGNDEKIISRETTKQLSKQTQKNKKRVVP